MNAMPKPKDKEPGFEETLGALESIVAQLESGELPLERALELFEQGVSLTRNCQSQLEAAERKVELLLRERGEVKTVPFEAKSETPASEAPPLTLVPKPATSNEDDLDDDTIPF
jgi:exodeoxyribonuclease VII small subunit